ncbi:MAG: hypothetical protein BRC58_08155 [Cyanobacteria bacterium QS_8_64_29]|nr:MAG: hypothetical protein BRC58_08155 [Cyanobacteria bacterium QS_8_64_29]
MELFQGEEPWQSSCATFLFRLRQAGGLPKGVAPEIAVSAVFAATRQELSLKRSREIEQAPPGRIQQLWQQA